MSGTGQLNPYHDEPELVERVRHGDREAFGALVDRYSDQAFAVAYGYLRHIEDAEDLVHDAFIRALERIESLKAGSPFGPWFYRLLVNASLNRARYLARRRTEGVPSGAAAPGSDDDAAERAELREWLALALESLPDDLRSVVVLHDLEGFKHSEIAAILEVPEGTCRSHLWRARRLLRDRLEEYRQQS